ncbi:MAG: 6-phosphogluconolactonase [Chloroflexi bacterium]|nr:6-phosphogluconolactonase [Chloroflexota bacterium]
MNRPHVHISPADRWSQDVSDAIARVIVGAVEERGRATVALSGGHTPRPVYERLAHAPVPWDRVHLFWGDERYVPHHDPRSNYRMAREVLIQHIPIPPDHVHPMPTHHPDPDVAAREYEATLRAHLSESSPFDLVLLGLGGDCHTASLFPHTPALEETERWVVPNPGPDVLRLTLTYPILNQARLVFFLVTGEGKAPVVYRVFHGEEDVHTCPARGIRPRRGHVHWWLDEAAARELTLEFGKEVNA